MTNYTDRTSCSAKIMYRCPCGGVILGRGMGTHLRGASHAENLDLLVAAFLLSLTLTIGA